MGGSAAAPAPDSTVGRPAQQMGKARFFLAGLARELRNQCAAGPIGEFVQDSFRLR